MLLRTSPSSGPDLQFSVRLHVRPSFSRTKSKKPPTLLSSLGIRGGNVYLLTHWSAQSLASRSENEHILYFRVLAVRDIKLRAPVCQKCIYLSRDFKPFLKLKY